jgi:FkbM family methyltransferase
MIPYTATAVTKDGLMMFPQADWYVGRSLHEYGEFSALEQELWAAYIPHDGVCVDVGANIGAHTIALARMASGGWVYAFEPQRVLYQMLCGNTQLAHCPNVIAAHGALGETAGHVRIPAIAYAASQNFGAVDMAQFAQTDGEAVPVLPLDSCGFERLDFLKVDVEGMECEVLRGATKTIARTRPTMYIENDRADKADALVRLIHTLGYRAYTHNVPLYNPDNFRENPLNVFGDIVSLNVLCIPTEAEQPEGMGEV